MISTGAYYLVYRYQYWNKQHVLLVSDSMATLDCIRKSEGSAIISTGRHVPARAIDASGHFIGIDLRGSDPLQ